MSQLTEDEQIEVLEAMREMLANTPDIKSIGALSMGEMSSETSVRAWEVFSQQIETMMSDDRLFADITLVLRGYDHPIVPMNHHILSKMKYAKPAFYVRYLLPQYLDKMTVFG